MYKVSIYDKSKKLVSAYQRIHTINYTDPYLGETTTVTGEELLTHSFPTNCSYQLLADGGNYSIDSSIIGTIEVLKVIY